MSDKADSLTRVRALRTAAARAGLAAAAPGAPRASLSAAAGAYREAERAGTSHLMRHGGGRTLEGQNADMRFAAQGFEGRLAALDAEDRRVAAARASTPAFRAARLAYQAEQAEDRSVGYHRSGYPGMADARIRELRAGSLADAARLFDEADAIDPEGGYAARAGLARERAATDFGSHLPGARAAYRTLARGVAADALDRLAASTTDQTRRNTAQRALLNVSSAYGLASGVPGSDRAREQRAAIGRSVPDARTLLGWADGWRLAQP